MDLLGLAIALLSAIGFSVSTSLQHHANETLRVGEGRGGHLVPLLHRPRWVVGQSLALVAFSLHAVALRLAPLVLVQPVVVSGIVLAVPVRAALERQLPGRRELGAVVVTAVALALFLVSSHPSSISSGHPVEPVAVTLVLTGAAVAAGACWWARRRAGSARAAGFGAAAGVLFGLTAGLLKLAATASASGAGGVSQVAAALTAWPTWVFPVIGVAGVVLNQQAYRAGPLSASMPLLNIVDVLVAAGFGVAVLGEVPAHQPWDLVGQVVGAVLMLVGLRALAGVAPADREVPEVGEDRPDVGVTGRTAHLDGDAGRP